MSVYTALSQLQLKQLLSTYNTGEILHYEGISDGIENTNYLVQSSTNHYILTIYEHFSAAQLPFFLQLLAFFRSNGLIVPEPIRTQNQQYLTHWQNKPAALFKRLPGHSILSPQINHCQQLGTALAQLHQTGQQFPLQRKNNRGLQWLASTAEQLLPQLSADEASLLRDELLFQQHNPPQELPQGIIHADLFCDNTLFEQEQLSGILDFYNACNDSLLFDLAVVVNDWCIAEDNYLDFDKARAMLSAYEQIRPLTANERQHWPVMLRTTVLRFWLSRLLFRQSRQLAQLAPDKDPDVLKCLLLQHRENHSFCQALISDQ